MANSKLIRNTGLGCLFVALASMQSFAWAAAGNVEFSADTVETMTGQEPREGRIYVGADRIRTDSDMNGDQIIQIIDLGRQQATVINTAQKSYMQRSAPGGGESMQAGGDSPCAAMKNLECRETGTEKINGRMARKYEISMPGQQGAMQVWIDVERKMPVRQTMPDGSGMEMRLLGRETLSGRKVEKWEMQQNGPGGQSQTSMQWYDPVLKMNIREERPGGYVRELTNIRVGKQPASLFSVPAGYSEITMPEGGGMQRGGGQ